MSLYKKISVLLTKKERKQFFAQLLLMLIGMFLEMLGVGTVVPLIALMTQDHLIDQYPSFAYFNELLGEPTQRQLIVDAVFVLSGLYFFKTLFLVFLAWSQSKFVFSIQSSLSFALFQRYQTQPWFFHLQRNSAQLVRNVTTEVSSFMNALQSAMMVMTEGLILLGIVGVMVWIEPKGSLIVAMSLGFMVLVLGKITKSKLKKWGKLRQLHEGCRIQHIQQGLGAAKDVKLLGREAYFLSQYSTHNLGVAEVARKQAVGLALPRLWLELLTVFGLSALISILLFDGIRLDMLLPTLGFFAVSAFRAIPSVNRILGALQNLHFFSVTVDLLYEELNTIKLNLQPLNKTEFSFCHTIELKHVVYQYQHVKNKAVNDVSLLIRKGQSVGFIGTSGAGKSTLIDLILGLLEPQAGFIKLDNIDIRTNLRAWQDKIGYVPQSIFLSDDTIKRNIAFGVPDEQIDNFAVQRSLRAAQLDEFVQGLPEGPETFVGERGVRLSGGQRQRIGIARALYHDPDILVLDEATSSLDGHTEMEVMKAINALHGKKTLIIVAHRLSTVENCDVIYRMENGSVLKGERGIKYKTPVITEGLEN